MSKKTDLFDKPFILSMGPQRCGTSWLDEYLRARGDVCLPYDVKEIFYFGRYYQRGLQFYKSHFKPKAQHKIVMAVSTTAFDTPESPARIYETLGDEACLICPLRHPVKRSYSLYQHYKRYGMVTGSLEEACQQKPQIITSSYYAQHLENWFKYFNRDQITFLYQENLMKDMDQYARGVSQSLGLEETEIPEALKRRVNRSIKSPNVLLAKAAQNVADMLRRFKLYRVIKIAKSLGLKTLIFGRGRHLTDIQQQQMQRNKDADLAWLNEQLNGEIEKLEALLGHPIEAWR